MSVVGRIDIFFLFFILYFLITNTYRYINKLMTVAELYRNVVCVRLTPVIDI